jgi:hypothetical protein
MTTIILKKFYVLLTRIKFCNVSKKERCTAVVMRQVTFSIAFQSRGRSPTSRKTANTSPKNSPPVLESHSRKQAKPRGKSPSVYEPPRKESSSKTTKKPKTKPIISPSALSEALRLADAEKDREAKTPSSKKKESSSSSCETPSAEASDEDGEHDDEEGNVPNKAEMTAPDVFKVIKASQKNVTKQDVG